MELFPKFVDEAASPPAKAVGTTVADIWNLTIGSHVSLWTKKQQYRQQQNYDDYIRKVEEKTQKIPEEDLIEPQLHIIGPAIEASKYYIESDALREMFANLIASSINRKLQSDTHPAFIEIIKQLSPYEAKLLKDLKNESKLPIAQIRVEKSTYVYHAVQDHIMNFKNQQDYKLQASSLVNLQRLGLLKIDYSTYLTNDNEYVFVETHPAFLYANEMLPTYQAADPDFIRITFQKGIVTFTPLAESFTRVCI